MLTVTTSPGQRVAESNDYERELSIAETLGLEPHHQMNFNAIPRTLKVLFFSMLLTSATVLIKKVGRDNHIDSRAWHDQPINRIGPLRPLV